MKYLPPFELLKGLLTLTTVNGQLTVSGSYDDLIRLIRLIRRLIAGVQVDDAWYLQRYPDIAEAIKQGKVESPQKHFVYDGYFEGRAPFPIAVNERWYLEQNPGVADFVRKGLLESGQQHFDENGYQEGRLPFGM